MPDDPTISIADIDDAKAILDLQKLAYQSEARLYNDVSIPPLTQTLEEIRQEFEGKTFLKAVLANRLVGSVRAACENGVCEIGRLIVHPDFQRRSIGTRLMHAIEDRFQSAERFELFTGERSIGNIRLYERLGYQIVRSRRLSVTVNLVYMQKGHRSESP